MTEDVLWTRLSKYLLHFEAPAQNQFATLKLDHFVLRRRLRDQESVYTKEFKKFHIKIGQKPTGFEDEANKRRQLTLKSCGIFRLTTNIRYFQTAIFYFEIKCKTQLVAEKCLENALEKLHYLFRKTFSLSNTMLPQRWYGFWENFLFIVVPWYYSVIAPWFYTKIIHH